MTSFIDRLGQSRVIATLRAPSASAAVGASRALVSAGVTAIEITYTTPDAARAISVLSRELGGDVLLGAGTVLHPATAREAVDAGAQFLVSPGLDDDLIAAMTQTGVPTLGGAITPTELMRAVRLGVDVVKLFPGSSGGPQLLSALRGPFPDVPMVPTGGVSADNVEDWFTAGALAVGASGQLCPADAIRRDDWDAIRFSARHFLACAGSGAVK